MVEQLKGKIYWIYDDFSYIGENIPKTGETSHAVARISNAIIDDNLIKFHVEPYKVGSDFWSYNVNLLMDEIGTKLHGTFTETTDADWAGEITCELFSNPKRHMLYGRWTEDEDIFTFWAIIEKHS